MIKPGQIYQWYNLNVIFAISHVEYTEIIIDGKKIKDIFNIIGIGNDGRGYAFAPNLAQEWSIIAEYPTWQEAVNSREFNNT